MWKPEFGSNQQALENPWAQGLRQELSALKNKQMESVCVCSKTLQSCLTLFHPVDCSLPGSSVHGILQARILEWVAMPSSRGSSPPRDQTCLSPAGGFFLPLAPPGKPQIEPN